MCRLTLDDRNSLRQRAASASVHVRFPAWSAAAIIPTHWWAICIEK